MHLFEDNQGCKLTSVRFDSAAQSRSQLWINMCTGVDESNKILAM
jgi:hypothetical protein